ncbi:uncharacterized protein LOC117329862 [Pecten maximus]|uniref:uncharacterized protein LOC117329862 n=1 Tax=Pecten maximus TaxID=6579 RepID=UPI00145863EA|nr:uncharacterized protein LOC117329862 [Pecten maximus]
MVLNIHQHYECKFKGDLIYTSFRFYAVHTKVNTIKKAAMEPDTSSILKVLKGESSLSDNPEKLPRAMKHGQEMEAVAKKEFFESNKTKHQNLTVDNSGFFIHPQKPFLGASPDLLTSCTCCGKGVVEIKCPVIPPCSKCTTKMCSCPDRRLKCFQYVNGQLSLKENHAYFGQIQGQMAVTGRHFCDFYVYTAYATYQQRIQFNSAFWINMSNNLEYFFKKYMIPDMLKMSTTDFGAANVNEDVEDMETEDIFGETYFCPLCHQKILEDENINSFGARSVCCDLCDKWYHFKCVKMTKSSLKSLGDWLCPTCMFV